MAILLVWQCIALREIKSVNKTTREKKNTFEDVSAKSPLSLSLPPFFSSFLQLRHYCLPARFSMYVQRRKQNEEVPEHSFLFLRVRRT